jgi:hypothetical protein
MFRQLAYARPSLPGFDSPKTYAAWPVWRDSTTKEVKFTPLPKKQATKLFHKARLFERRTRVRGRQDGALGRNGILVLHALAFDFLHYMSGRLDPSLESIAQKACISVSSVKRGLAKLKRCGVINWLRRAAETRDEQGRFCLEQDTNAYAIMPVSYWLGFIDQGDPPPPHSSTWGATPPLPTQIEQAAEEMRHGQQRTAMTILETDPGDTLATGLASLFRAVENDVAAVDNASSSTDCRSVTTRNFNEIP